MRRLILMIPLLGLLAGCKTQHTVKTESTIAPIHITLDINLKIDKALDDFFNDID